MITIPIELSSIFEKWIKDIKTIDDFHKILKTENHILVNKYFRHWLVCNENHDKKFFVLDRIEIDKTFFVKQINSYKIDVKQLASSMDSSVLMSGFGLAKLHSSIDLSNLQEKIQKILELDEIEIALHNQPPGIVHAWHYDSMNFYYYNVWSKMDSSRRSKEFDFSRMWIKDDKFPVRLFLALDDWAPGQLFQLGTDLWYNWRAGDIMWFDWKNLPHATANASLHNRPLIRITGLMDINNPKHEKMICTFWN